MQKGHLSENELTFLEKRFEKIFNEKMIYDECKDFIEKLQGILSHVNKGKFAKEFWLKKRKTKGDETIDYEDIDISQLQVSNKQLTGFQIRNVVRREIKGREEIPLILEESRVYIK